jgi:hypothetical protein
MGEKALAVPFESEEIIEIAVQEFRKRLQGLSPLQLNKEYAGFEITFNHKIMLHKMGANGGGDKETLAWSTVQKGDVSGEGEMASSVDEFKSGDPNTERLDHDLPLTVEGSDGKGNKIRKKVKVKDDKR